jgi:hypothetical protein
VVVKERLSDEFRIVLAGVGVEGWEPLSGICRSGALRLLSYTYY